MADGQPYGNSVEVLNKIALIGMLVVQFFCDTKGQLMEF